MQIVIIAVIYILLTSGYDHLAHCYSVSCLNASPDYSLSVGNLLVLTYSPEMQLPRNPRVSYKEKILRKKLGGICIYKNYDCS